MEDSGPVLRAGFTGYLSLECNQVDEGQSKAYSDGAKPAGARLSVAPIMINKNIMVITTSADKSSNHGVPRRRVLTVPARRESSRHVKTSLSASDEVQHSAAAIAPTSWDTM